MKIIKIILVAGTALLLTLAVLGNVTMPDVGVGAVKTAVGMETTFKHPGAMWRAITSPALVYTIFGCIVLVEAIAAALCWIGAARMWAARKGERFIPTCRRRGKTWTGSHCSVVFHRLAGDCR